MRSYLTHILFSLSVLLLVACGGDSVIPETPSGGDTPGGGNNTGGDVVEHTDAAHLQKNTYSVGTETFSFGSVAATMLQENLAFAATSVQGLTSYDDIIECDKFLFGAINPLLAGKRFDLMSESSLFTFISTLSDAVLEGVTPETTYEIEAGEALFTYQNEVLNVKADITLVGGTAFSFHVDVVLAADVNENTIVSPYGEKPLRSAFYHEEDGMTYLYFSPAGISYFDELEIATWYLYIAIYDSLVCGQSIDITTIDTGTAFVFGMVDNLGEASSFRVTNLNLNGATGNICITRNATGDYTADIDILYGGNSYAVWFDGLCTSALEEEVVEQNYLDYNGQKLQLTDATLSKGDSIWTIAVSVDNGTTLTATAPASFFDGNPHGFSQSTDLAITYQGVTYNKAAGYSGTFTALLDESEGKLSFAFTNYDNIELSYDGSVTIN